MLSGLIVVLTLVGADGVEAAAADPAARFPLTAVGTPLDVEIGHAQSPETQTVLGVDGVRFTLNGRPTFLLGMSYYGGLGAPRELISQDLDDLQRHGFNWLRLWATWGAFGHDASAVDARGESREPYLEKLQWLVAECDRRGIVVDVTLTRGKVSDSSGGRLPDMAAHQRAVETIIHVLRPHRNWYLDLANERDVRDDRYVGVEELKALRAQCRRLDPQLLVTASFGGHDLSNEDVSTSLKDVGLDFLAPHRPRNAESPGQTKARTQDVLAIMKELGRVAPVHYQEPFRRGYVSWQPTAQDFVTDLRGAVQGGAAGWCLHNGSQRDNPDHRPRRSFDLREQRLFVQLDAEERQATAGAHAILTEGLEGIRGCGIRDELADQWQTNQRRDALRRAVDERQNGQRDV